MKKSGKLWLVVIISLVLTALSGLYIHITTCGGFFSLTPDWLAAILRCGKVSGGYPLGFVDFQMTGELISTYGSGVVYWDQLNKLIFSGLYIPSLILNFIFYIMLTGIGAIIIDLIKRKGQ